MGEGVSSIEELLDQAEPYAETGEAHESEIYCIIHPESRTIEVPEEYQLLGVVGDKKVERLWFKCPKVVGDSKDISDGFVLFINFRNADGDPDAYRIKDMEVEGENITFSWELEEKVTAYQGTVEFSFRAIKPETDSENKWNTTINNDCNVLVGLQANEQITKSEPDALAQIWAAIDELKAGGGGSGTPGKDGREIEIQNNGTAIQWRYVGDESWTDLVQLSEITGEKGDPGTTPTIGENGNWYLGDADTGKPSRGEKGDVGDGVPSGGTTGQVLTKNSDSDGDASWKNPSAVSDEQVKTAVRDYFEENPVSGMTQKQINALDSLFRVIAYSDNDVLNSEYKNFKEAFGLSSEDEPGDAGEGLLKNGSATFSNGATLTVSDGKHVSLYLPKKDGYQFYFNISDYEKNTTDAGSAANVDNQLPIYTLKKGDTVSISMYNIIVNGGDGTYPGNNGDQVAINLRKANSNISCSTNNVSIHGGEAIEDKTSITEMELEEHVGALMLFVQNNFSDITITFDIDVKVNGETIKWY